MKKTRKKLFDPQSSDPFKLSRSKLENFMRCKRCFYLDRRLGIGQPPSLPFTLNSAVDQLLKKEFDHYRGLASPHPLFSEHQIDAIPFSHPNLEDWRNSLHRGIQHLHVPTNLLITGGVDDLWVTTTGELIVVDYKATSKNQPVNLDADWQIGYKRQIEIYQWLFRQNGFDVHNTAFFVYCNGRTDRQSFDSKLEFHISVLPYVGNTDWIEPILQDVKACLLSEKIPEHSEACQLCQYVLAQRVLLLAISE